MEQATTSRQGGASGVLEATTLCEAFQATAVEYAERPALRLKDTEFECSWAEFAATVRRRAAAFDALGVERGDTVGFMLVNRPALHLCDAAAMHLGATCYSIYNTSSVEQIEYLVGDAASQIVVTEPQFVEKLLAARERIETLEQIVVIGEAPPGAISLEQFEALADDHDEFDFEATWRAVEPEDVLCLIYTSGTTGPPKGVQLTHANVIANSRALHEAVEFSPAGRTVSFLPTAHAADRILQLYGSMIWGNTVHCCPDPRDVVVYSVAVKPTIWGGVPRIWEKLKAALEAGGIADPATLSEEKKAEVRANLGLEECEWFGVGAAPTPPEVLRYFAALGIEICELWGMSETTVIATTNHRGAVRVGTVGQPLPGIELKLADDGELLVRGPTVMKGYRNMPEKTAETLSEDGWLATGDIGEIDDDGYVTIVDRKKELIINAAGKNMSPANIEAKIKAACPLAAHVVAIGDRRPYNVALIVLDPDACGAFAAKHDLDDPSPAAMAGEDAVREAVAAGVEAGNGALSRVEQIKKFHLVEGEWAPGGEELTPTLKLKRRPIERKYEEQIEALYA
jgi:long-subunit acyl-CoA synthetase (AMP-forming)